VRSAWVRLLEIHSARGLEVKPFAPLPLAELLLDAIAYHPRWKLDTP
jgi:hypothetical protein